MNTVLLGIIALAVVLLVVYFIYLVTGIKKTLNTVNEFIVTTESSLKPTLEEVQVTLQSIRKVTDDVGIVTDDIKDMSGSVKRIGENIEEVSRAVKQTAATSLSETRGIKAGIKAGVGYFIRNACPRRDTE